MSTQSNHSLAESLSLLPLDQQRQILTSLPDTDVTALHFTWRGFWARPSQLRPGTPGAALSRIDWQYWLCQCGRGWGKTKTGAETTNEVAELGEARLIHLVAPTVADIRKVMIEGPSGILACSKPWFRPMYEPSKGHKITWPNGVQAFGFSAEEPDRLRGPQAFFGWCDEPGAWIKAQDTWDMFLFGLRLGPNPQAVLTTTPRPTEFMKSLVADPLTVITRGGSYENRANLSPQWFSTILKKYEGTRLGRQELDGELLEDFPGALWTTAMIESARVHTLQVPHLVRIVVAIDPAVTSAETSDETGIVAVGLGANGHLYVLDDESLRASPGDWARKAVLLWCRRGGDRIIAEVNNGGDMVEAVLRGIVPNIPFRKVHATRGKLLRAEPAAALYERGLVHHVGFFPLLEAQMVSWVPNTGQASPDRVDALTWALFDLVLDPEPTGGVVVYDQPVLISPY